MHALARGSGRSVFPLAPFDGMVTLLLCGYWLIIADGLETFVELVLCRDGPRPRGAEATPAIQDGGAVHSNREHCWGEEVG